MDLVCPQAVLLNSQNSDPPGTGTVPSNTQCMLVYSVIMSTSYSVYATTHASTILSAIIINTFVSLCHLSIAVLQHLLFNNGRYGLLMSL